MSQNSPFDMFKSSSSKPFSKKKPDPSSLDPNPAKPLASSDAVPSREDVTEMFAQINQMKTNLLAQYEQFCEKTGLSREEIHNFFDNPNNFSPQKWEDVQKSRSLLEQQIVSIFGKGATSNKSQFNQKKLSKERKSKTLGARQKWIQM